MDTIGSVRGQICPPSLSFMFTIFLCLLASVDGDTEFDLMNTLLVNYDKRVIPRKNDHPLLVSIGFSLIQVHSLDEKNQRLTSSGWFQVEWKDYRLMWNTTQYNRSSIVVPSKELWLPDVGFLNSNGDVLWVPGGTYHTTCELNISKFPFDKQSCYYHLTNWAYNIGEMNLTNSASEITMSSYKPSAEWNITGTVATRQDIVYECCGNVSYPSLYFFIWIERKSLYYVVNIIIPCIILSMLATFTFCVPPDSGEKISLGITLLLSFTVFQLIVAENIPRRSDSVPVISLYISVITGIVTASIICTIFISQLHHRGTIPFPRLLRTITFDILARAVCLSSLQLQHGSRTTKSNGSNSCGGSSSPNGCSIKISQSTSRQRLANGQLPMSEVPMLHQPDCGENLADPQATAHRHLLMSIDSKIEQIVECMSEYESRRNEDKSMEFMREEWYAAGKVFDRFFFIIYVVLMMAMTVKFLIPVSDSEEAVKQ